VCQALCPEGTGRGRSGYAAPHQLYQLSSHQVPPTQAVPPAASVVGGASERSLAGATREAQVLLEEVDAQFRFS